MKMPKTKAWFALPSSILALAGCAHRPGAHNVSLYAPTLPAPSAPAAVSFVSPPFIETKPAIHLKDVYHAIPQFFFCPCGGIMIDTSAYLQNRWLLPLDPLTVLDPAYLGADSVEAGFLDPIVRVGDYPPGHFGDHIYDGNLATAQGTASDEMSRRAVFFALAEALYSDELAIFEVDVTKESLENYVKDRQLKPDMYFVFHGKQSVAVEIDTSIKTAAIKKTGSVGIYYVDGRSILLLKKLCQIISQGAPTDCTQAQLTP